MGGLEPVGEILDAGFTCDIKDFVVDLVFVGWVFFEEGRHCFEAVLFASGAEDEFEGLLFFHELLD